MKNEEWPSGGVGLCVLRHADDADEAQMTADLLFF